VKGPIECAPDALHSTSNGDTRDSLAGADHSWIFDATGIR
jgi:hypothetical protein